MKLPLRVAVLIGILALTAAPALANGKPEGVPPQGSTSNQGGPKYTPSENGTPGPNAGLPEKAKAYGRYCKGESKKHVKGEKGTAFSRCVTNAARAAQHPDQSPAQVCKGESRKHVKGEKGTAYSRCVSSTAKLRRDERRKEREEKQGSA